MTRSDLQDSLICAKPWGTWCKVDTLLPGILNILLFQLILSLGYVAYRSCHHSPSSSSCRSIGIRNGRVGRNVKDTKELLVIVVDECQDQIIDRQRWVLSRSELMNLWRSYLERYMIFEVDKCWKTGHL